jgi:signal transduction histidine kinase
MLPVLVLLLAAAVIGWTSHERRQVAEDLDRLGAEHVESVARLIREGAREAAASIDLVYALSEDGLDTSVRLVGLPEEIDDDVSATIAAAGLLVWVVEQEPGAFVGIWGDVPEADRSSLLGEVLQAEPGEIVDFGVAGRLGIYCAYLDVEEQLVVVCKDAAELAALRRETGIGPLLSGVAQHGVIYAAIQDEGGILASSPGAEVSTWEGDPELEEAREGEESLVFRIIDQPDGGVPLFEGLGSFPLPDGTDAVLRVGVDASHLISIRQEVERRHRLLYSIVGLLVVFAVGGTWLLNRWDLKRQGAEQKLALHEEASRRWQAIGQMAASVAHEVRNPLNTVKMVAQRLRAEFKVREGQADYDELVDVLQTESDRVNAVVTEFMELGRPVTLNREAVSCSDALGDALIALRMRAEQENKKLDLEVEHDREVSLDRNVFAQILSNLVGNALDAVEEEGKVSVTARCEQDGLLVLVRDDGPGMDAETLERVQQPFETTKPKGTGLGLPVARRLAESHGGDLVLSSEPGRGTVARLLLRGPKGA